MANKSKADARAERAERAAALLREQRSRERKRNVITGAVVAVVLAALVVGAIFITRGGDDGDGGSFAGPAAGESEYGLTVGEADAPHSVVVYEDFLCPACGAFESATAERLATLAEEGQVYLDYRPFVLLSNIGDYSARSAEAFSVVLEESGPEVAKSFHDILFANQPSESDAEFPDAAQLTAWAVEAGAEESAVAPGIEAGAGDFAENATSEANDAGVSSTPTLVVDGELFQPEQSFEEIFDVIEGE